MPALSDRLMLHKYVNFMWQVIQGGSAVAVKAYRYQRNTFDSTNWIGKNEDTGNVHSQATLLCTLLGSAACLLKYLIYAALHQQFKVRLL